MSILRGNSLGLTKDEVEDYGGGLAARIKFEIPARQLIDRMVECGVDHHMMLALGDITSDLTEFCNVVGIEPVRLDQQLSKEG